MSLPQKFFQPRFIPAHFCSDNSNGDRIAFAMLDANGKLKYQYIKLNRIKKQLSEADYARHIETIINDINAQLFGTGTSETADERQQTPLLTALQKFIADKERELRPATMRSYKSLCHVFGEWFVKNYGNLPVGSIKKIHAVKYLEYYYNERKVGNNCYNNQMKLARGVFTWFVQHCYIEINPFENIPTKRNEQKKRGLIDKVTREKITRHLTDRQEWGMLLVCHLVYSALIRPKEVSQLLIGDINLEGHYITIRAEVSKTHTLRTSAITPDIVDILVNHLHIDRFPQHYFLLGSEWTPARTCCNVHLFSKRFLRLRSELRLPQTMQLYSLRDSGITDLLTQGIDPITTMQHAGHHSLDITTRYANHVDAHRVGILYNRKVTF